MMTITVKDFVEASSGVDEFEVHGTPDPEYKAIGREYGFFFRSDLAKNPPDYEKFKDRQIDTFSFKAPADGWIVCEIYLKD
jgi:hypothetical protein